MLPAEICLQFEQFNDKLADLHDQAERQGKLQRAQGELTVIEYTTKLDFILEKLNAAHQGESGGGLATTAE